MMPSTSATKSARQTLGETLKFYREQRGFNQARVADITKATRSDVEAWEAGRVVPNGQQWELLKKMVHRGLAQIANVRQMALSEESSERALAQRALQRPQPQPPKQQPVTTDKPLTTRPFAVLAQKPVLSVVPDLPKPAPTPPAPVVVPAPAPVTPAREVPPTLLGETFDLTDAYTTVNALPRGWGTAEAREARTAFAKELLIKGVDTEAIVTQTRAKFQVGISRATLKNLREEIVKDAAKAERKALRAAVKPVDFKAPLLPNPPAPLTPVVPVTSDAMLIDFSRSVLGQSPNIRIDDLVTQMMQKFGRSLKAQLLYDLRTEAKAAIAAKASTTPAPKLVEEPVEASAPPTGPAVKDIETAAQLVLGVIPNLRTFTIEVNDAGEVTVSHTIREVRVIESSASLKMKR